MNISVDYAASHAVFTLDPNELLQRHVLEACIRKVVSECPGIWNIDISLPVPVSNADLDLLRSLEFLVAGTATTQSQVVMTFRRAIRRSGDGGSSGLIDPNLAVPGPVLAPSNEERQALIELFRRNNWALPEAVKPPMSTTEFIESTAPPRVEPKPKPEPKPEPTLLQQAIAAEQRRLDWEAQHLIDSIQPRPEGE
jgi:hypothetical protein